MGGALLDCGTGSVDFGRGNLRICRRGQRQNILLVALHRPNSMNAFDDELYLDLVDLLRSASIDDSVAAIVVTGAGKFFSSGADLKKSIRAEILMQKHRPTSSRQTIKKPAGQFMTTLIQFPKLLAAAVQGPTIGIAMTMLMHFDLVHCSYSATFWAPFTRLALVPELCSSVTFSESMGMSKANELLILGRRIDAKTACDWNICSRVVDCPSVSGDQLESPRSLANQLCGELDQRLFGLPLGDRTANYFVSLIRNTARKTRLQEVCRQELSKLDERFNTGQVGQAAKQLTIGSTRSRL